MLLYFAVYFLAINIIGLMVMLIDKRRAIHHQYRIPEKTLWFITIIGGAIGTTLGMWLFRHKTKHISFKWGFPFIAILQVLLLFYYLIE